MAAPGTDIRERCEQASARITARIRAIHEQRCATWDTWTERVKDQDGRAFVGTFDGCRACGVAMLRAI